MNRLLNHYSQNRPFSFKRIEHGDKAAAKGDWSVAPFMNHKERYGETTAKSIKPASQIQCRFLVKNSLPRLKVSVDFAAEQWFRILLVHINSINSGLNGILELPPGAISV